MALVLTKLNHQWLRDWWWASVSCGRHLARSRLLISRLKPHRGKGSSGAPVAASNFASFFFFGPYVRYVLNIRIHKIELQITENNLPCLKCEKLWIHLLHHSRYVFTALYIGVFSLVVFSSDVFSQLSFVWLCFRSLRFHRHSTRAPYQVFY